MSFPLWEQFHWVFLSRNSTVLDESFCTLEPDFPHFFPRYDENRVVFKNPKFHGARQIGLDSRFWYSTVREISLGILDPHYIPSGFLGKATNSPDNFAPSYKCVLSQKYLVPWLPWIPLPYQRFINTYFTTKKKLYWTTKLSNIARQNAFSQTLFEIILVPLQ